MNLSQPYTVKRDTYTITTDVAQLDIDVIYGYLTRSYWKPGVPKDHVARSFEHSLCFGLFEGKTQVGFARVITDYVDFAYLCDVFVLETHQGDGLGSWLLEAILAYPGIQTIRSFFLATRDAQEFYRPYGFSEPEDPNRLMFKTMSQRSWYNPDLASDKPTT